VRAAVTRPESARRLARYARDGARQLWRAAVSWPDYAGCRWRFGAGLGVGRLSSRDGRWGRSAGQSAIDLNWAATIAFLTGDQATALELARRAIHGLQWGGDRIRVGLVLHMIAAVLAATRPDAAAIIQGAAQAHAVGTADRIVQLSKYLAAALGAKRARELHARGADMDWDKIIAYTLTQTTQALSELQLQTSHKRAEPSK
jgi:hypothetical protein